MNDAREVALKRGLDALLRMQNDDGSWEGECVWCPMLAAQYAIASHLLARPLSDQRRARLLLYFQRSCGADGLWGLHPDADGSLFVTTLVYVASRLLGETSDAAWLRRAHVLFAEEQGVAAIPTWGKFWLALVNLYDWEGVHPLPPEVWLLPSRLPVHPANYYCHTRLIYLSMAVLYGSRWSAPRTPLIEALRAELYPRGYSAVDFARARYAVASPDLWAAPGAALRLVHRLSALHERFHSPSLRRRALAQLRERLRWDLQTTNHTSLSPVNGLLGILALAAVDREDPDVARGIAALDSWIWEDDREGARVAGARSSCWDTGFALQTLAAAGGATGRADVQDAAARGARFLASQQIRKAGRDYRGAYRIDPTGGWCFSRTEHGWPVSDCTAEALVGLLEVGTGDLDRHAAAQAVRFMLRCQNRDGGFGSYEPKKSRIDLDWMNPSEMFGRCMTEQSYVECTASCIMALAAVRERFPNLLVHDVACAKARARRALVRAQNADGSWNAAWGVNFIYGTMFGVRGLLAAGAGPEHPALVHACLWLLRRQREDGGWGEHARGCLEGRYIANAESRVIQTAWALIALVEARCWDDRAIDRAASFLATMQDKSGEWPDGEFAGVFFETALLNYRMYRQYFPAWALALFCGDRFRRATSREYTVPARNFAAQGSASAAKFR